MALLEERTQVPTVVTILLHCEDRGVEGVPVDWNDWSAGVEDLYALESCEHVVEVYFGTLFAA